MAPRSGDLLLVLSAPHGRSGVRGAACLVAGDRRPRSLAAHGRRLMRGRWAVALRLWAPEHFTRWVAWRAKGWWRSARVPLRMAAGHGDHRLVVRVDGEEYLPKIVSVRSSGTVDLVRVRMLPGQVLEDWADNAPRLAQTFGTQECRVRTVAGRRRDLELWFLVDDPLTAEVRRSPWRHRSEGPSRRGARGRADLPTPPPRDPPVGRRCDRFREGLGAVVDHRRPRPGHSGPDGAGLGARPEGRDGAGRRSTAVRAVRLRRPQGRHGLRGRLRPRSGGRGRDHAPSAGTVARGVPAAHPDPARSR